MSDAGSAGRSPGPTSNEQFNSGAIVRTHLLRPTCHFVLPEDIRWMLALTAPRSKRAMASRDRELELNDELVARTNEVVAQTSTIIARALESGKTLPTANRPLTQVGRSLLATLQKASDGKGFRTAAT